MASIKVCSSTNKLHGNPASARVFVFKYLGRQFDQVKDANIPLMAILASPETVRALRKKLVLFFYKGINVTPAITRLAVEKIKDAEAKWEALFTSNTPPKTVDELIAGLYADEIPAEPEVTEPSEEKPTEEPAAETPEPVVDEAPVEEPATDEPVVEEATETEESVVAEDTTETEEPEKKVRRRRKNK